METETSPMMNKAAEVKDNLIKLGSMAADAGKDTFGQVKDGAANLYSQGCGQAKDLHKQTENYVKENPMNAVLIAGAAGVLVGVLAGILLGRR